jgi:molybdopterin-containing oxidoreductase family membrane subunit
VQASNLGCLLIYAGVYIEKGMGLVIPGLTPDTLGEIFEYVPTMTEVRIGVAIFSIGFLVYTFFTKIAVGITMGDLTESAVARRASWGSGAGRGGRRGAWARLGPASYNGW